MHVGMEVFQGKQVSVKTSISQNKYQSE